MPESVFVDTGYILALVNENDQHHAEALALSERFDGQPVVVTDAVLLEIGNALSRMDRDAAVQIIQDLRESPEFTRIPSLALLLPLFPTSASGGCTKNARFRKFSEVFGSHEKTAGFRLHKPLTKPYCLVSVFRKLGVTSALIEAGVRAVVRDQTAEGDDRTPGYRNRRLEILGQDEIDDIYGLPRFSDEERELYFALTPCEKVALEDLHSTKSKIAFILQLGYFKARRMFFVFTANDVAADLNHVAEQYSLGIAEPECTVSKRTRLKHQRLILALCNYKICDDGDRRYLEAKVREAAMLSAKPIYMAQR